MMKPGIISTVIRQLVIYFPPFYSVVESGEIHLYDFLIRHDLIHDRTSNQVPVMTCKANGKSGI